MGADEVITRVWVVCCCLDGRVVGLTLTYSHSVGAHHTADLLERGGIGCIGNGPGRSGGLGGGLGGERGRGAGGWLGRHGVGCLFSRFVAEVGEWKERNDGESAACKERNYVQFKCKRFRFSERVKREGEIFF